jgi:hypothetical protein
MTGHVNVRAGGAEPDFSSPLGAPQAHEDAA